MPLDIRLDPRGSLWRKWDLHFHTPASYDYRRKTLTDEQLVSALQLNKIDAVVVTDHHRVDPDRILSMRQLASGSITFFPGIELRCELGGTTTVHYIGIFPEDIDVHDLWIQLQGKLEISPSRVQEIGDDKVWVPYDRGTQVIRELGGLVSIHAGQRTNSIETIKNKPVFKQRIKTDILRECVDFLEVTDIEDCEGYRDKVFPAVKFRRPLVMGSDNHDAHQYSLPCPCWIRGDASFAALKHLCSEPTDRVYLGEIPPSVQRVSRNRTRYVRSVEVRKTEGAALTEKWFDGEVQLNHGLVAIIGNKGSGKSALADILGLLGDSHAGNAFSFLTPDKFCNPSNNKARFFKGTITWESGGTHDRLLSERVTAEVESVKYLPQEYIEQVCNELQEQGSGKFSEELASVIFSHVAPAERLNCGTFEALLKYKTAESQKAVEVRRQSLRSVIEGLVDLERQSSPANVQSIKEKIEAKRRELAAFDLTKPTEVPKPIEDESTRAATQAAEASLRTLGEQISELQRQIDAAKGRWGLANRRVAAADRLSTRLTSFEASVELLRQESAKDLADLGLSLDDLIKVTVDTSRIKEVRTVAVTESQVQTSLLDPENDQGIPKRVAGFEKQVADIKSSLNEPAQKYQQYVSDLREWEKRRASIEGTDDTEETLKYHEKQLAAVGAALAAIPDKLEEVIRKAMEVYDGIVAVATVYSELYAPVQRFIEKHPLAKTQFKMSFETKIVERRFTDDFLSRIAQNRKGSFAGSVEGRERVQDLLRQCDFNKSESATQFLRNIWHALHHNLRSEQNAPVHVADQLAKNVSMQHLYELVFGFGYLAPFFTLRWAGKDVQQLSPGERGTLLLVFYLLIDQSDIPLIIDQPEENLDNQTVYDILVPSIKEARSRRQVVIVTHNPNLAVVCDADQVICASIDKEDGNRVTYDTGAIENPAINKRLLDILEGTRPAFDNRDSKYHPIVEPK